SPPPARCWSAERAATRAGALGPPLAQLARLDRDGFELPLARVEGEPAALALARGRGGGAIADRAPGAEAHTSAPCPAIPGLPRSLAQRSHITRPVRNGNSQWCEPPPLRFTIGSQPTISASAPPGESARTTAKQPSTEHSASSARIRTTVGARRALTRGSPGGSSSSSRRPRRRPPRSRRIPPPPSSPRRSPPAPQCPPRPHAAA